MILGVIFSSVAPQKLTTHLASISVLRNVQAQRRDLGSHLMSVNLEEASELGVVKLKMYAIVLIHTRGYPLNSGVFLW